MPTLRKYRQPANLPGHKYAGPLSLSGANGRPLMTWQAAPFARKAAPGTQDRSRERVQAHADRVQIMKAHYVQQKDKLQRYLQQAKAQEKNAATMQRDIQKVRAGVKNVKNDLTRNAYRKKIAQMQQRLDFHKEDQKDTVSAIRMHKKELSKLSKEIDKISKRAVKNKAQVKRR